MTKSQNLEAVNSLADKLKPQMSAALSEDKSTAVVSLADNAYVGTLPEGITPELLKKIDEHNAIFYPAATKAFGQISNEQFAQNKDLKTTNAGFALSDDRTFQLTMHREKQFHNPKGDDPITKHGYITAGVETSEASTKRGLLKSVCDEISEATLKLLVS